MPPVTSLARGRIRRASLTALLAPRIDGSGADPDNRKNSSLSPNVYDFSKILSHYADPGRGGCRPGE